MSFASREGLPPFNPLEGDPSNSPSLFTKDGWSGGCPASGVRGRPRSRSALWLVEHHYTRANAISAAPALEGATSTPAASSVAIWRERTCGSASVPVTEATTCGRPGGAPASAAAISPAGSAWARSRSPRRAG